MTIQQALTFAHDELSEIDDAISLSYLLLSHCLSSSKEALWQFPNTLITPAQFDRFQALVHRAKNHEPLAYLTGMKEFYGRNFIVTQDTLIPRSDTELLIDKLLTFLSNYQINQPKLVDVGTGSGNIAITLALEVPQATVYAIDVSPKALKVAQRNAQQLNADNIIWLRGSLLEPLEGTGLEGLIDAIAANLPYVSDAEYEALPLNVKNFEPELALRSGTDADRLNDLLFQQSNKWLRTDGLLVYETTNGRIVSKER